MWGAFDPVRPASYIAMLVKTPWQSRTIWLNLIALLVGVFQYFVAPIPSANPQVFALVVAVINLGLRFRTNTPVAF